MEDLREKFNAGLCELINKKKNNSCILTKKKYNELILQISEIKKKTFGKKPEEYHRLKRYDNLVVDGVEKLIYPIKRDSDKILFFVHEDELFDIIHKAHLLIGHGGRNRMLKELKKKYKNITAEEIMMYLKLCEICQKKSKVPKKGLVKPMVFKQMNSRCQVDLIDMQSQPDDDFKFICVYQDHLTKFVQLRALKSKSAEEVADNLIDIFTAFGAPSVLQSDNGCKFSKQIVEKACSMWPDLKIVHRKPRHSQTQGSVERTNQNIENMLSSWLEQNQTTKWSKGLRFVQFMKNMAFHEGIKCSPYEAMFGTPAKIGLKTSFLPNESVKLLKTEEELEPLCNSVSDPVESIKTDIEDSLDVTLDSVVDNMDFSDNLSQIKFESKEDSEPVVSLVQSDISSRKEQIKRQRDTAKESLELQAKKKKFC